MRSPFYRIREQNENGPHKRRMRTFLVWAIMNSSRAAYEPRKLRLSPNVSSIQQRGEELSRGKYQRRF
jgi:hypothetical protein